MIKENYIRFAALFLSVALHAVFFVQLNNSNPGSQAQAPKLATRISLNLLTEVNKTSTQQVTEVLPGRQKKPKKEIKKQNKIVPPVQQQAVAKKVEQEIKREESKEPAQLRQSYLAQVLNHIEGYKYYPRAARVRGIEGSIQVSFRLQKDGNVSGLSAQGESIVLRRAAKGAVNKALPLPVCPQEIDCPIQVSYAMQFQIR